MSRVLCCYVKLSEETAECLNGTDAELVPLDYEDSWGYLREITNRWNGDEDLIIIEQDMTFTHDQLDELRNCPEPWCAFGYKIGDWRTTFSLGFTKLSAELRHNWTADEIGKICLSCSACRGDWWHIDLHTALTFEEAGYQVHDHGDVGHLHYYKENASIKRLS